MENLLEKNMEHEMGTGSIKKILHHLDTPIPSDS